MKKTSKELQGGILYFISNIVYKCIAFITIPIFTRIMSTTEYGIVSTYISYVNIFQVILGLSTEFSIRNAFIDYKDKMDEYISSIFLLSTLNTVVMGGAFFLANRFFLHLESDMFCVFCIVQSFMTYVINVVLNRYMMEEKCKERSFIMLVPNIVSVVLGIMFIMIMQQNKDFGRILGYVIAFVIWGGYYLIRYFKQQNYGKIREYWKYALIISLPLIIHAISVNVLAQFDRIMISYFKSEEETGIYSIIYSLSMVSFAATGALQNVWIPWFTSKLQMREYIEINKKAKLYIYEGLIITAGIMLAAPEVLKFMTRPEYWTGINLIIPLVAASFIVYLYSFSSNIEIYHKSGKVIATITAISAVSNIIFNYFMIPKYGAVGAAYATLISYCISYLIHFIRGKQLEKNLFGVGEMVVVLGVLFTICIVCELLQPYASIRWIIAITLGLFDLWAIWKVYQQGKLA